MKGDLPERVIIRASETGCGGVAVRLCFVMDEKNHYNYLVFLDDAGLGEARKTDYLAWFDQERRAFIMDYVDPRVAFTGGIGAVVLQKPELEAALRAFDMFGRALPYPSGHKERLERALAVANQKGEVLARMRVSLQRGN